jgi:hypothetical protein
MHQIALLFERGGLGVAESDLDAFQCHKFATELGHPTSQGIMGEFYELGRVVKREPARRVCFSFLGIEPTHDDDTTILCFLLLRRQS